MKHCQSKAELTAAGRHFYERARCCNCRVTSTPRPPIRRNPYYNWFGREPKTVLNFLAKHMDLKKAV